MILETENPQGQNVSTRVSLRGMLRLVRGDTFHTVNNVGFIAGRFICWKLRSILFKQIIYLSVINLFWLSVRNCSETNLRRQESLLYLHGSFSEWFNIACPWLPQQAHAEFWDLTVLVVCTVQINPVTTFVPPCTFILQCTVYRCVLIIVPVYRTEPLAVV